MHAIAPRTLLADDPDTMAALEKKLKQMPKDVMDSLFEEYYNQFKGRPDDARNFLRSYVTTAAPEQSTLGKVVSAIGGMISPFMWEHNMLQQSNLERAWVKDARNHYNMDSSYSGEDAIVAHKRRFGVNEPYLVVDKKNNRMTLYRNNEPLETHYVTLGSKVGDMAIPNGVRYYSQTPRTTGAGVFTARSVSTSPYTGNEPMFVMDTPYTREGKMKQALHSPANYKDRLAPFHNQTLSNRVSFGCVSGDCGVVKHIYDDGLLQAGDSIYVLPEVEGNQLIEKGGKL